MGGKVYHIHSENKHFRRENIKTMTNQSLLAMVVTSSGALQNSILALMTTIPRIRAVLVTEEFNAALRILKNHQIALILLDMSSLKVKDAIHDIKTQWPRTQLIVLVEDTTQEKVAEASDADCVLMKGFSAKKLVARIEVLLSRTENNN